VIVGGGMAGVCAAITAARGDIKVVLGRIGRCWAATPPV